MRTASTGVQSRSPDQNKPRRLAAPRRKVESKLDFTCHCETCPANTGEGIENALRAFPRIRGKDILFIGSQATKAMALSGDPLDGADAKVMDREMKKHSVDIREFDFISPIQCHYDMDKHPTKVNTQVKKHCYRYIQDLIRTSDYKSVVVSSAEAISSLAGVATKMGKYNGVVTEKFNAKVGDKQYKPITVIGVTNPRKVLFRPEEKPIFESDARMLATYVRSGYDVAKVNEARNVWNTVIIDDLQVLVDMKPELLCFDLEAVGTRPYEPPPGGVITMMQFCTDGETAYVLPWDHPENKHKMTRTYRREQRTKLRKLLTRKGTRVFGHNVKFDKRWLAMKLEIDFEIADDTIMTCTLINENIPKNLDDMTKVYVPEMGGYADEFNAKWDKSRMDLVPLAAQAEYGGGDVVACYRLLAKTLPIIAQDKALHNYYRNVTIPALNMFSYVDEQGTDIREDRFNTFREMMAEKVAASKASLLQQVPKSIRRAHAEAGLEFSRSKFILDILFNHPDGFKLKPVNYTKKTAKLPAHLQVPSTSSKDHLPFFFEECPFTAELAQYNKDAQLLNTNLVSFENRFIRDGRIFPVYHLHMTTTGRTSSSDPNGQNIPKRGKYAKAYRQAFVPPSDDWLIMEADLSQAELRIAADTANDKTMLNIYRSDGDIHKSTGMMIAGMKEDKFNTLPKSDQKEYRQKAKAVNFGFLYGMGWRTFITYAKTQYNVEFSENEARKIREGFFKLYPGLVGWHLRVRKLVREQGFVRSLTGRIRHLPQIFSNEEYVQSDAERQAINSPIQECASTLGVIAMTRLSSEIDPNIMKPFAFVHDAIYVLVRKEYADWGARTLKWYMESNPVEKMFGFKFKLPIKADVAIGANLGDQFELEGLKIDEPFDFVAYRQELLDAEANSALKDGRAVKPLALPELPEQLSPPNNGRREEAKYSWYKKLSDDMPLLKRHSQAHWGKPIDLSLLDGAPANDVPVAKRRVARKATTTTEVSKPVKSGRRGVLRQTTAA